MVQWKELQPNGNDSIDLNSFELPIHCKPEFSVKHQAESLLNRSLIELYDFNETQIDTLWRHSDELIGKYFHFNDAIWKELKRIHIYPDDPVSIIFSQNLRRMCYCFKTNDELYSFFSYFRNYSNLVLGKDAYSTNFKKSSKKPIIQVDNKCYLENLNLKLFDIPSNHVKILNSFGFHQISDIISYSESMVVEKYSISKDSVGLIDSIWEVSFRIKSIILITEYLKHSSLINDSLTMYDYLLTVLCLPLNGRKPSQLRNIEIALSYLLNLNSLITNKRVTFDDLSQLYSMTRSRIQQIVNNIMGKLESKFFANHLIWLWLNIYNILYNNNGAISISAISKELQETFSWRFPPDIRFLSRLLDSNPVIACKQAHSIVIFKGWPCVNCSPLENYLDEIDGRTPLTLQYLEYIDEFCIKNCSRDNTLMRPDLKYLCALYGCDANLISGHNEGSADYKSMNKSNLSLILDMIDML